MRFRPITRLGTFQLVTDTLHHASLGVSLLRCLRKKLIVLSLKREYARGRAVIGRYCSNLSRRPPAGKTCLSLTSRVVSSKATETPFTRRACPDSGALEEAQS